jgi:hypothetical protein
MVIRAGAKVQTSAQQAINSRDLALAEELDLIWRVYLLRKARRLNPIYLEFGVWYLAESEANPWHNRHRMSWDDVRRSVEALESLDRRKPPEMESASCGRAERSA